MLSLSAAVDDSVLYGSMLPIAEHAP